MGQVAARIYSVLVGERVPADQPFTGEGEGLPTLGDVELDRESIKFNVKLGEGSFGEVFQGSLYNQSGEKKMIAIKKLKGESMMSKAQFVDEARIMRNLNHPNIVQLYGVCRDKDPILIITEYMDKGSLETYIMKDQGVELKIHNLEKIAHQITLGMSYLEHKQFVHRDLRTANVLLSQTLQEEMKVKVADLGLTKLVGLAGVHQLGADMNARVIQRPMPSNCSEKYFDTMKKCLASKPENRPTFKELERVF